MSHRATPSPVSRRWFLGLVAGGSAALAAACGGAPASPTAAPKAAEPTKPAAAAPTTAPAAGATTAPAAATTAPAAAKPTEAAKPAAEPTKPAAAAAPGQLKPVPRNRTLILMFGGREGRFTDAELWNNYALGTNHQTGNQIIAEPLAFYSAFADKTIYWLAESHKYSPDFKQLDIKIRPGAMWSDGKPFTAEDVAYTLTSLRDAGAKLKWGVDVKQFVDDAKATSPTDVHVTFKVPAPKFFFFMSYKYGIGIYPVPKHVFEGQDWTKFGAYDLAKGWPVTTSAYKVVMATPDQKVLDRRDDWWGVKAGIAPLPKVERIIFLPVSGETQMAQSVITNQIDCCLDLRPTTIKTVLAQNPKITTHVGNQPPYGYVDWWPTGLYINYERAPFDDPKVRWAISYFLDRQQIVDIGYGGAGSLSPLPLPLYPGLKPFVDSIADLLKQYPTNEFNIAKGTELLQSAGWAKGSNGLWAKGGQPLKLDIWGWTVFADIGPIIAEQLKRQGIDANYSMPPDAVEKFGKGDYPAMLNGHGGSVSGDPYFTMRLYQSKTLVVPDSVLVNQSKWKNDDYDKIVDEMAVTPAEDQKKLTDQFRRAMAIWLPALPDIQITEWYHRIPMNTTYWKGWPTKDDSYVNGAFWALTGGMVIHKLEPTQ